LRLYGASWPLGIDSIELRDKRDTLPQVWQDILGAVEAAGVTVTESAAQTETPQLTIVRGPDTWSTAEAAARYLANVNDRERICIIAGDATAVLDQQLARRQAPTLGIADSNAANPSAQILLVFLGAVLPPTDIGRVRVPAPLFRLKRRIVVRHVARSAGSVVGPLACSHPRTGYFQRSRGRLDACSRPIEIPNSREFRNRHPSVGNRAST